jgi:hydroxymethylpyrimidine pyrophosphatase-like HAD family hydrolase
VVIGDPLKIEKLENEFRLKKLEEGLIGENKNESDVIIFKDKINFFRSEPSHLDCVAEGIDKAESLKFLLNRLGFLYFYYFYSERCQTGGSYCLWRWL